MSSSTVAGERRWVPGHAKRGGMTVLGRVVVPKPLNLPSQRLENHGLDPNVEIVPKGSHSWGSRSSSSASNPWGSSALSPNADGASGSPSHLSGRPTSGGSGTRPSTAGSDRTQEPTASAWGPNSRPSSASGASTANQTSLTSLRPRSAETRPGSSPLSRFAEPLPDNSGAWGPTGTVEKLVVASSKNDGFSLSSGDFPTLGSEKDNAGKNIESQDHGSHGRPSSSSSRAAHEKEKTVTSQADVTSGNVNSWKRDGNQHVEDGVQPRAEKWQGDPQQYLNANIPPQQFEAWHGPPMNAPAGVWYRGPPGGPQYPPVAPGGFPMEPFPYFRPQFPAPAMVSSQPVPHAGAGPRGNHPKNVDLYRPHVPDAYIHPGMPIRPGFYPGPVAYEGYYGPPMGYCNSNEHDIPFMGTAAGPPVHGRYSAQNTPEAGNNHARAGGRGPTVKPLVSEQLDSGHSEETRGPYKVLMKQHNEWGGKEEEENWERSTPGNASCLEKGDQPRRALPKSEWGADNRRDREMYSRTTPGENFGKRGSYSSENVIVKSHEGMDKAKAVDDSGRRKSEIAATSSSEAPQVRPATPKDPTLIQKIEGLNAKARATDGWHDAAFGSSREEQKNRLQVVNAKANTTTNDVGTPAACLERTQTMGTGDLIPAYHEEGVSTGDKIIQSTAASAVANPRRSYLVTQGRVDDRGKGRISNQDADAWRKKPQVVKSSRPVSAANVGDGSRVLAQDHHSSVEADEKCEIDLPRKDEEESLAPIFDPSDCQAQRAKIRQRGIQLQKEEEERIREQKAKAHAKLEELNRRTQAADGSIQKLEKAPPSGAMQQVQIASSIDEQVMLETKYEAPSSALAPNHNVTTQIIDSSTSGVGESTPLFRDSPPKKAHKEPVVSHGQSLPSNLDDRNSSAADRTAAPQVNDSSVSRQKRMGYKQKQNTQVEKNSTEKLTTVSTTEAPKGHSGVAVNDIESTEVVPGEIGSSCESSLPDNSHIIPESSSHQRRKNNRSSKSKPKMDDTLPLPVIPSPVPREINPVNASSGNGKLKPSDQFESDPSTVQLVIDLKDPIQPAEQHCPLPTEEAHGRGHKQWKPQHSRRVQRNPQANRPADKFHGSDAVIWAPVRSQSKAETMDGGSLKGAPDVVTTAAKNNDLGQSSVKSKRAEMERYVPKPVAKELSQQVSVQQPMPSAVSPTTLHETAGRAESGFQGKAGSNVEAKNGDAKQNKQGKAHGAWRQRGSTESHRVQGSSLTANPGKNVQKYMDQQESFKPVIDSVKEEPRVSDEWNDGWHMPEDPPAAAPVTSDVKYQGAVTGKGKRHPHKGHRNIGNNHDLDLRNTIGGETDKRVIHSAAHEISQPDTVLSSKENRGIGEQKSTQWQAKLQGNYQRGSTPSGDQNVTEEVGRAIKKDSPLHQDKESNGPAQFVSENKYVGKASNVGHRDGQRERKVGSSKGRPHSPNEGFVGGIEKPFSYAATDGHQEQQFSSGFRKNGSQNNRSVRGHESRGDWSSAGQDNKPHNMPPNRERRRQNSHYEYQPVGSYNNNKSNNFEGPTDGSRNFGPRYRERDQGQDGRNFYGRQSGTVQVDGGNDWQ